MGRTELPLLVDDSHFFHPLIPFLAESLPSFGVPVLVLFDVFLQGVQGPVGSRIRNVHEERIVGIFLLVFADE